MFFVNKTAPPPLRTPATLTMRRVGLIFLLLCSVPMVVLASMHKLTPYYFTAGHQEAFGTFVSPQDILRGGCGGGAKGISDGKITSKIHAINPLFEYIPPDLVTLFISNMSGCAPSYVYRLLSEFYHPDDYEL